MKKLILFSINALLFGGISLAQIKVHPTGVTCIGFTSATPTLQKGLEVQDMVLTN